MGEVRDFEGNTEYGPTTSTGEDPNGKMRTENALYTLVGWVRENSNRAIQDVVAEFDDLFITVRG